MTPIKRRVAFPLLCALLPASAAAQALPDAVKNLVNSPPMKALGLPAPQGPTAWGGYTMTSAATGTVYLHNKTSDGAWVAVVPALARSRFPWLKDKLRARLTDPVLVVALADGTSTTSSLPDELRQKLPAAVVGDALRWKSGANLLGKLDADGAGPLKLLQDSGVYPGNGGALLTGTVSAAVLAGDVNGEWSISLDAALGAWKPPGSPLQARSATFRVRQSRTGVSGTANDMTFGMDLTDATLSWPGFSTPSLAVKLELLVRSQTDCELSGGLAGFKVGPKAFKVTSNEFFYASSGPIKGVGLRVKFQTTMGSGTQSWTAQAKASTDGALSFAGTLDSDWKSPFGLRDFSFLTGTGIDFSFAADADLGVGLTGNLRKGSDTWSTSTCANIVASAPPVLKAVGLSFDPPSLSPAVLVEMAGGLMLEVGRGSPDPKLGDAMRKTAKELSQLPLPLLEGGSLFVYTPGLTCAQPKFAGLAGFGGSVTGHASFLGASLAKVDNGLALNGNGQDRFWMKDSLPATFKLGGMVALRGARIDVNAPLAVGPNVANAAMVVTGRADVGNAKALDLTVNFSKDKAQFDFDSELPALGLLKFKAESVGKPLDQMTDFKLSAAVQSDPALQAAMTKALKAMLLDASKSKKDASKAGYDAVTRAATKLSRASSRLREAAKKTLAKCSEGGNLGDCITQAVASTLKNLDEYKDWLLAVAEYDRVSLKYYAERATYETWSGIETALGAASTAAGAFSVKDVSLEGSLKDKQVTVRATWAFMDKGTTSGFTVQFGDRALGSGKQRDDFFDVAAYGGGPQPAKPQLKGVETKTLVVASDVAVGGTTRKVLTVTVQGAQVQCPDGVRERPSGTVYLYKHSPGDPKPDPFTADPTKPVQIGTALLGKGSSCSPDGTVKFNYNVGSGDNGQDCPNVFRGIAGFQDLHGPVLFSALFQGGPTACSAANADVNHPDNGFRASLSDEVQVDFPAAK